MSRVHLFELEDQSWFPDTWRRYMTEYLQFMMEHGPFEALPGLLARVADGQDSRIVDLCSGAGGPWPAYLEDPSAELDDVEVLLTDLHPNREAFSRIERRTNGRARGYSGAVDATHVPSEIEGPRTLVNGFHHFRPAQARAILADAVKNGVPIGVFEVMDRRLVTVLSTLLVPLFVLLLTPFIRPFRLGRLFWTYLVPVLPLFIFWDGLVSALRVYSPDELRELAADFDSYAWEADAVPAGDRGPSRITYLIGKPR